MKLKKRAWVFDFDGTLSDLTENRQSAVLNPRCRKVLRRIAADDGHIVAIISSRALDDLILRVTLPGLVLAGGSGMEFLLPTGRRVVPQAQVIRKVESTRKRLLPNLQNEIANLPGVDIEDKYWSVAVHTRHATAARKLQVRRALISLTKKHGLKYFRGPEVVEIPFIAGHSKSRGLRNFVRLYPGRISLRRFAFSGDDQSDLEAMKWVRARGGNCIIVGKAINLAGAKRVESPETLASEIQRQFDSIREIQGEAS